MKDIRVKRSGDKEEVLESLKDNIFGQLTNALIFAASVGFKNGERIPLSSKGAGERTASGGSTRYHAVRPAEFDLVACRKPRWCDL